MEVAEYVESNLYEFITNMGFKKQIVIYTKLLEDPIKFIKVITSKYSEILVIGDKRIMDSLVKAVSNEKSKFFFFVDNNLGDKIIIFYKE